MARYCACMNSLKMWNIPSLNGQLSNQEYNRIKDWWNYRYWQKIDFWMENIMEIRRVDESFIKEIVELCRTTFIEAYQSNFSQENISVYCEKHYNVDTLKALLTNPKYIQALFRFLSILLYYLIIFLNLNSLFILASSSFV